MQIIWIHGLISTWCNTPEWSKGCFHGQILFGSLINNINEDTKGKLTTFTVDTKLEWQLICSKKESGFKKISSDWNYGLILIIQDAGRTSLTEIHMKKTWIFNWEQAQYDPQVWAKKAKAFLSCIKRNVVSRKRSTIVLLVIAVARNILTNILNKYFVRPLLRKVLTKWSVFRGDENCHVKNWRCSA